MKKVFLLCALVCAGHMYGMEKSDEPQKPKGWFQWLKEYYSGQAEPMEPELSWAEEYLRRKAEGPKPLPWALESKPFTYTEKMQAFPQEAKAAVISALNSSVTLDDAINALKDDKALEEVYNNEKVYNNLEEFTDLTHILAKKYNTHPMWVAIRFEFLASGMDTKIAKMAKAIAKQYFDLNMELHSILMREPANVKAVRKLIDEGADITGNAVILSDALSAKNPSAEMIQFLLDHEANPNARGFMGPPGERVAGYTALEILNMKHSKSPEYEQIKQLLENAMQKEHELKEIIIEK